MIYMFILLNESPDRAIERPRMTKTPYPPFPEFYTCKILGESNFYAAIWIPLEFAYANSGYDKIIYPSFPEFRRNSKGIQLLYRHLDTPRICLRKFGV
jgi:hypothetical protein